MENHANNPRHILIVEDTAEDYELITHELQRAGGAFSTTRIDSTEELARELDLKSPAVVLCDHGSARWDSLSVLRQVRRHRADLPFILVTGAMGESAIARALEGGANDLVFKHQLSSLGPAVRRALQLEEEISLRRAAERERDRLRQELEALRAHPAPALIRICAECKRIPEPEHGWVKLEDFFTRHHGVQFSHGLCPVCVQKYYADFK